MEVFKRLLEYRADTWGHVIMGFLFVSGFYLFGTPLSAALIIAILAGYLKEEYDRGHPETHTEDPVDFQATVLGAILSTVMHLLFTVFFI